MNPFAQVLALLLASALALWVGIRGMPVQVEQDDREIVVAGGAVAADAMVIVNAGAESCVIHVYRPFLASDDDVVRVLILAHEIGHCYGLGHIFDRPSVMCVPISCSVPPTAEDIAAAKALRGQLGHRLTVPLLAVDGCPCGMAYAQPVGPVTPLGE